MKESKITHLSTWVIVRDAKKIGELKKAVGKDVEPVTLRLRVFGEEGIF